MRLHLASSLVAVVRQAGRWVGGRAGGRAGRGWAGWVVVEGVGGGGWVGGWLVGGCSVGSSALLM